MSTHAVADSLHRATSARAVRFAQALRAIVAAVEKVPADQRSTAEREVAATAAAALEPQS